MPTIREDVDTEPTGELDRDSATAAFLERWKDPSEVSKGSKGAKEDDDETIIDSEEPDNSTDQTEEDTDKDPDADTEDGEETKDKPSAKLADDDAEVSYTVDGVERKASVKELKRLAGQEVALTRKSQEVAAERKVVDDIKVLQITALNTLVERAEARYKPYANLDMLVLSKELSSEDLSAIRAEAQDAYNDYKFLTEELGGVVEKQSQEQLQSKQEAASACIQTLLDPEKGIPGWSQTVYDEVRTYAKGLGMSASIVDNITDPAAIKIIHKAMAFDNIKKVATTKKATSAKKVLSSTSNSTTSKNTPSAKSAMQQLKQDGSRDAAANAFLSRWEAEAD